MEDTTNSGDEASEVLSALIGSNKRDLKKIVLNSDLANAERFVKFFGEDLRFVPEKGWYHWNGAQWVANAEPIAIEFSKDTVRLLIEEALTYKGEQAKTMYSWAVQSQASSRINAIHKLAASDDRIRISITDFDSKPWAFNCQNGTISLKTGQLLPHDRLNYFTRISPAEYGSADCPLWLNFIDEITSGSKELAGYLKRVAGYCLTGSIAEKCWFFCYGDGDNGKSVFIEVLQELMGDYSIAVNTQTLTKNRQSGGIPNDVARLNGPRLASVSETGKGEEWNDKLIKDLTGGDTITARFLNEEFFDFRAQCKLMVRGNNKPEAKDQTSGMWRRLQLIPFEAQIPLEKQDKDLREKIVRRELSGVLAWAVEGCLEWQKTGLAPPESVTEAVRVYRQDTDILGQFLEEKTERDEWNVLDVKASILYNAYREWCHENGHRASNSTVFGTELRRRNYTKIRKASGLFYTALFLKEVTEEPENNEVM